VPLSRNLALGRRLAAAAMACAARRNLQSLVRFRFRQMRGLKGNTVRITHQGPKPWLPSQL